MISIPSVSSSHCRPMALFNGNEMRQTEQETNYMLANSKSI